MRGVSLAAETILLGGIPEPSRLVVKPKAIIGALGFQAHY
jgi:hypothetical protein